MGIWLTNLRIVMFLLISLIYFTSTPSNNSGVQIFIGIAALVFIANHVCQFYFDPGKWRLAAINVDGVLSFLFAFVFPGTTLYLILVGVTAITLFIVEARKKILGVHIFVFFLLWSFALFFAYIHTSQILFFENVANFCFVVFGAVVGNLIHRLFAASETVRKQYKQLNESHTELSQAHQQLTQYSQQLEQLTLIRERNRIAREIHDTVGHKMTALLVQLELVKELMNRDEKKSKEIVGVCDNLVRSALEEIRFSVKTLENDTTESISFIQSVRIMLEDFHHSTDMQSVLELEGDPAIIPTSLQLTISRVIQETLTNAKRHGAATMSTIHLGCFPEKITLNITDNGIGINEIKPGFGLRNMKERMKEHDGTLRFESIEGKGFYTYIEFALTKKQWIIGGDI
ncbi:histidine kinase [Peribacillus sp. NPDC096379]|uniref:histidine kinase n=1 Tax=Peribacillus sp. NPDC096379 TaxID=3364393 RepID=UPI00382A876A